MRNKILTAAIGLCLGGTALFITSGSAQGHGYSDAPTSRQAHCANGTATDCGAIQWEPQSVEGPKGFPEAGPADGSICSAGNEGFAELDDPRGGDWPTTQLEAGGNFTFRWNITAAHSTTDFRYYITKDGYDPSQPLTRDDLEPEPFLTESLDGQQPPNDWSTEGTIPEGKSGRHLVLGVWNIEDTANAFYSCADVEL
ncbi:lytic polysaccharide monooxygenase auxiliary activity family 9 protein [Streptomyces sp. NPDC005438]|uniref:lytic polysaccharide monooxygenase auxiliary activity family 9 protein n=1 Tax=Streptomyces sp. NPDC005438 TaxID=3156880 RepID=UPI00339FE51C